MPFRDVIGHRRIVGLLARSIPRASLPPSLILAGPAGVGKRKTAIAVAQAFNCLKPVETAPESPPEIAARDRDACGVCPACKRIERGVHPDVLLVEPGESGSIKVDQVRDVVDRAGYRPFEGKRRVVIVDDADALVHAAQSALLKTLEEPPPSSVFILVTSRPDMLLATVRSRCPQLRFRSLSADEIARVLIARGYKETEARAVAATADGSVGRALDVSAGELVEARDAAERVLTEVGSVRDPRRRLERAKDLLPDKKLLPAIEREHVASRLRAMSSLLRDVELLTADAQASALANPDVQPLLTRLAPAYRGDRGVRAFAAVDRALTALEASANIKIVADWIVLQL